MVSKGVNDTDEDVRQLINLIARFPSIVNLIPFNPWPGKRTRSITLLLIREAIYTLGERKIETI